MAEGRPGPERSCIGCRAKAAPEKLARLVCAAEEDGGRVLVDWGHRLPGRGAWLCRAEERGLKASCFQSALRKKAFNRAFRVGGKLDLADVENAVNRDENERGQFCA